MVAPSDEPKILFLEDEPVVALDAVMSLRENGYAHVTHVSTLREAEQTAAREPFDLAILDINIDGASSIPLAKALHQRGMPVIFASAYRPEDSAVADFADGFVSKPYTAQRLVQSIEAVEV